eukprot:891837-Amphidinium_carterae.1
MPQHKAKLSNTTSPKQVGHATAKHVRQLVFSKQNVSHEQPPSTSLIWYCLGIPAAAYFSTHVIDMATARKGRVVPPGMSTAASCQDYSS